MICFYLVRKNGHIQTGIGDVSVDAHSYSGFGYFTSELGDQRLAG